jgi:ubiquinone/menaquinone biosynthesis C-methylase UbiE
MSRSTAAKKARPAAPTARAWTVEQTASLARHFRLERGMNVLGAGSGGPFALSNWGGFCRPRGKFTALIPDRKDVPQTKKMLAAAGLGRSSTVVTGRLGKMPFKDNRFDVVLAHIVLSGEKRPEQVLDELIRVTRPGGCVAVFEPYRRALMPSHWDNAAERAPEFRGFVHRTGLQIVNGMRALGAGDKGVGYYVPGWMETRGLKNVNVRANEQVFWQAPPYRSPASAEAHANSRKVFAGLTYAKGVREHRQLMKYARAGGAGKADVRRWIEAYRQRFRSLKEETLSDRFSSVTISSLICAWGFKP